MVVGAGGTGPFFVHVESDLGVHADHADVMEAVRAAAADAAGKTQQQGPVVTRPVVQGVAVAV